MTAAGTAKWEKQHRGEQVTRVTTARAEERCSSARRAESPLPAQRRSRSLPRALAGACARLPAQNGNAVWLSSFKADFLKINRCLLHPCSFKLLPCKFQWDALKKISDQSHRNCWRIYKLLPTSYYKVTPFLRWRTPPTAEHRWRSLVCSVYRWCQCVPPQGDVSYLFSCGHADAQGGQCLWMQGNLLSFSCFWTDTPNVWKYFWTLQLFRAEEGKSLALELCEVLGAVKGGPWTTWVWWHHRLTAHSWFLSPNSFLVSDPLAFGFIVSTVNPANGRLLRHRLFLTYSHALCSDTWRGEKPRGPLVQVDMPWFNPEVPWSKGSRGNRQLSMGPPGLDLSKPPLVNQPEESPLVSVCVSKRSELEQISVFTKYRNQVSWPLGCW